MEKVGMRGPLHKLRIAERPLTRIASRSDLSPLAAIGFPHLRRPGQGREAAAEPGPIHRSRWRGHGVWVPAFAGTTLGQAFGQKTRKMCESNSSERGRSD